MIVSANFQAGLDEKKTHVMVGYFQLRPQVFLELYVDVKLWQAYLAKNPPKPTDSHSRSDGTKRASLSRITAFLAAREKPSPASTLARGATFALSRLRHRRGGEGGDGGVAGASGPNLAIASPSRHEDKTQQEQTNPNRRQAEVQRPERRLEAELDRVRARGEIDAAHDVIAAQQGLGLAIHRHFPVRVEAVVEQQHRRRRRIAVEDDVLRGVAAKFDGAGVLAGAGSRQSRRHSARHKHASLRVE